MDQKDKLNNEVVLLINMDNHYLTNAYKTISMKPVVP